jgi:4-amino-4-deoxy-L-arabinose transferase-like glycosyltransferase
MFGQDCAQLSMSGLRAMRRGQLWPAIPIAIIALLLGIRALVHVPPVEALAPVASEPGDPLGTTAYAGSIYVARGGPVIIGFVAPRAARVTFAGHELYGSGFVRERHIVRSGPAALRVAIPSGTQLVWSPVGRRGDPEYVSASSLSADPPERAHFSSPGTAIVDGVIATAMLFTIIVACVYALRRRLAKVPRTTWLAMAAVFVAAVAIRWFHLNAAGQTWDEDANWAAGRNYVSNLLALDLRPSAWQWNYEHPPIMKYLVGIGALFADGFGPARAISALLVASGCALLVPIGRRLFRLRVGVVAAAIAALLPPLIAHGKVAGHEVPSLFLWSVGVLLAVSVHDDVPTDERATLVTLRRRLAVLGLVIGIAIASRFLNGLLGPLCALIVVVMAPPGWRASTIRWGAILMPAVALVTFYAVWPRLWAEPMAALSASFHKFGTAYSVEPFLGTDTATPGRHYFVVYLLATVPTGVVAFVALWVAQTVRRASQFPARSNLIVAAWAVIPLLAMFSPLRRDGVRYIIPCFAAAIGVDLVARWFERGNSRSFVIAAAVLVSYLAITAVRAHPYYLDYFAEHTGGAGAVARRRWFETAWWGEGLDRAVAYVNANAEVGAHVSRDCIEPAHLAWFREDLWLTVPPSDASWIVVYAPRRRACALPPLPREAHRVFAVEHDGVVMAEVYRK